ncbi:hypothetical protein ACIBEA_39110 [Streptomyces sp. NPDC051555]|uniref:hypothetical protein n=1 Tax=Streptomyces sp. NPDC051555 TaxID=3365657 RepID=UPI0037B32FB4
MIGDSASEHRTPSQRLGREPGRQPARVKVVSPRRRGEVGPWLFEPAEPDTLRKTGSPAGTLAVELARQLLALVEAGAVKPGQVIYDIQGIVLRIIGVHNEELRRRVHGSNAPAGAFQYVAMRYNLVRHRPVRDDDPPPPAHPGGRTRSWEISPAAPLIASVVAEELAGEHQRH